MNPSDSYASTASEAVHRPLPEPTYHDGETGLDSGRKVSVRYAVRGFWRNQWYPSIETHRAIYIAPHLRGPEDRPIQGAARVLMADAEQARRQLTHQQPQQHPTGRTET